MNDFCEREAQWITLIQSFIKHYSLPPLVLCRDEHNKIHKNYEWIKENKENLVQEYETQDFKDMKYLDWVEYVNKDGYPEFEEKDDLKLKLLTSIRLLINGIRGL